MSCTSPIYCYIEGFTENGKNKLHFCTPKTGDFGDVNALKRKYGSKLLALPCGRCLSCKLDYAKQWATRCVLESISHNKSSFITLTYDEKFVPEKPLKSDFQKFLKRLRKAHPDIEIRYFGCGERGSENGRPHYHLIIFGYDFPDRQLLTAGSNPLYRSQELESLWTFGISSVGDVTLESCSYVARYTSKKFGGIGDEFILMSRMPGLGSKYFEDNKDLMFITDKLYGNFGKSHKVKIPRYFMKLAESDPANSFYLDLEKLRSERVERANNYMALSSYLHQVGDDVPLNKIFNEIAITRFSMLRRSL